MKKRIAWIDNAKFIGIFIVVLGHLPNPKVITDYIFSFHMPLFFFLSGITFSFKNEIFKNFVGKISKSTIIPYVTFGFITYTYWLCIGRNFGRDALLNLPWYRPIIGMFYSNGIDNWLVHNTPLWFLTCLFITKIVFYVLIKIVRSEIILGLILVIMSVIGYLISLTDFIRLPWGINIVPISLLFFGYGYLLKKNMNVQDIGSKTFWLVPLLIPIGFYLSTINGNVDMNGNSYNNYFLFILSAFLGIFVCIIISQAMGLYKITSYIGKNTLVIFTLHGIAFSVFKGILILVFKIDLRLMYDNLLINTIFSILIIAVLLPVNYFINRYFSILIGK